jgi:hypothetical protein
MKRAPIRSAIFAGAARRTDAVSLAGALAMPGTVDVTCMAVGAPEPHGVSETAAGVVGFTLRKPKPSDDGSATSSDRCALRWMN